MRTRHIAPTASVHPSAFLHESTIVAPGCSIGPDVKTGANVHIHSRASIQGAVNLGAGVEIGPDVTLVGPLEIAEHVCILRGAVIGLETAGTSTLSSGLIGKYALIGKDAVVLGNLSVGEYARVSDGARLEGDLPNHAVASGSPAFLRDFACKCGRLYASVKRISPHQFRGRCPVCHDQGFVIPRSIVLRRRYVLLPNQQVGWKMPE